MRSRRMEFLIGTMVLGIVAGVFIMTLLFGSQKGFFIGRGGRQMTIFFERASGISQNSVVKKNGIKIGRVYSVDLVDAADKAEVRVAFELDPEAKIYSNEYAKINRTLMGDASIEFVKNPDFKGEIVELKARDAVRGISGDDLMGTVSNIEGDLAKAIQNVNQAAQGLTLFMGNLNAFLGDENELNQKKARLQAVFSELNETLVSIKTLATHMDSIVADQELNANIRAATAKVPQILQSVDNLTTNATALTADMRQTIDRAETTFDLIDKNLDNVDVFTTSLAEQGPEAMTAINETAVYIRQMSRQIAGLAEKLALEAENPETTLGMLSDKETARSLRRIVQNAEDLTEKLRPVLDDARVFSNKIAHRPSSLIWDKNSFKGAPTSGRYGMQSLTPTGGVSSPLYRQTPSGAKVCLNPEKNYRYRPLADVDFMDSRTRNAYENVYRDANARVGRWSLDAFWNKIFAKNDRGVFPTYFSADKADASNEFVVSTGGSPIYSTAYSERPTSGTFVGNAAYSDANGFGGADFATFDAPPTASRSKAAPLKSYSETRDASAAPSGIEELPSAVVRGAATSNADASASALGIEELPSAVVRGAAVSNVGEAAASSALGAFGADPFPNGGFEDDGLPMQFAPPTNR